MNEIGCAGVPATQRLVRMRFTPGLPGRPCAVAAELAVEDGRWYVVATGEGERLATPARHERPPQRPCSDRLAGTVCRPATEEDLERERQLADLRAAALCFCRRRARELGLPLRPVVVNAALDRQSLAIIYAAEERLDVRQLARDLCQWARRRVELRPAGVRDQAKACGGLGHCGRALCCTMFMNRFSSVTVRMAKEQRLALNPARISGMCGRLMCCLAHEAPAPARPAKGGE